jgi:hypothetical protein
MFALESNTQVLFRTFCPFILCLSEEPATKLSQILSTANVETYFKKYLLCFSEVVISRIVSFVCLFVVLEFELRTYTLSHSTSPFL